MLTEENTYFGQFPSDRFAIVCGIVFIKFYSDLDYSGSSRENQTTILRQLEKKSNTSRSVWRGNTNTLPWKTGEAGSVRPSWLKGCNLRYTEEHYNRQRTVSHYDRQLPNGVIHAPTHLAAVRGWFWGLARSKSRS